MGRKLGLLLVVCGLIIIAYASYQFIDQVVSTRQALIEAEKKLNRYPDPQAGGRLDTDTIQQVEPVYSTRAAFQPVKDEAIGILEIPKLETKLPIIEGTDEEMLAKGVGHYAGSVFPSDGEQILLSGHRDTVFRQFGKLEVGDRLIVKLPYGTFEYEIREIEIVDEDNTTVIGPKGEEVLTVSTCYPFRYIGHAPQRYVVYAYPVLQNNGSKL